MKFLIPFIAVMFFLGLWFSKSATAPGIGGPSDITPDPIPVDIGEATDTNAGICAATNMNSDGNYTVFDKVSAQKPNGYTLICQGGYTLQCDGIPATNTKQKADITCTL